jgi:hypothetical protein
VGGPPLLLLTCVGTSHTPPMKVCCGFYMQGSTVQTSSSCQPPIHQALVSYVIWRDMFWLTKCTPDACLMCVVMAVSPPGGVITGLMPEGAPGRSAAPLTVTTSTDVDEIL